MDNNADIVRDLNTPLTSMDISSRQKIHKEIAALSETLNQTDLTDIFRVFHLKAAECTFFSGVLGTLSRAAHT